MKKPKIVARPLPTPKQQRAFARKFREGQWEQCAESEGFRKAVEEDLVLAERIAVSILKGEWSE